MIYAGLSDDSPFTFRVEKDEKGRLIAAPKGVKRIETKALDELFQITRKDTVGKHPSDFKGAGQVRHDDSKPY